MTYQNTAGRAAKTARVRESVEPKAASVRRGVSWSGMIVYWNTSQYLAQGQDADWGTGESFECSGDAP